MTAAANDATKRPTSGRWIVATIVVVGAAMGLAGFLLRGGRGPGLPFKPGAIVLVTCSATAGGLDDPDATRFAYAVAPSSELVANLGALVCGRMPRESGLVRAGDSLPADVPTLAQIAADQGFATAAFVAAGDGVDWKGAGLLRGFTSIDADAAASDRDVATRAAEWLVARGTSPAFALVHLGGKAAADAEHELLRRLREGDVLGHATVVRAQALATGGWHVPLSLRLPVALRKVRVDERPVSLVDVVPSLCEVFGIRVPDGFGPPFLLDPNWRGPRFALATSPLSGPFADADEVSLCTTGIVWLNRPTHGNRDELDAIVRLEGPSRGERPVEHDAGLSADFHKVLVEGFGYRLEEVVLADLLRAIPGGPIGLGVAPDTRVLIAHHEPHRPPARPAK